MKQTILGCGVGLRAPHYSYILSHKPSLDFFEAISENYMDTGGRPVQILEEVRKNYPVALHGVALSIGSSDPLDKNYLKKLKTLIGRIDPFVVSDHLCWSGVAGHSLHDLLPLPFTEEAVDYIARRILEVQEFLGRPILLENASTYVTCKHSTMPEWEFLTAVARRSDSGILLDLNNIFVNAVNHKFNPYDYLKNIPGDLVGQFHLAGHTNKGKFLFDTHSSPVIDAVWKLYEKALELCGPVSTLVEWDEAIPEFPILAHEAEKAKAIYKKFSGDDRFKNRKIFSSAQELVAAGKSPATLYMFQTKMKSWITPPTEGPDQSFGNFLNPQGGEPGLERMAVYADGYLARIHESLSEVYETVKHLLGSEAFIGLSEAYAREHPSLDYNLNHAGGHLPEFIRKTSWAKGLAFLPDLAKLEWEMVRAFHAFDQLSVNVGAIHGSLLLANVDAEKLQIKFQPSVSVISSDWPVLDIWKARKIPLNQINIDLEGRPQCVLIFRQDLEVRCELIDPAQEKFLQSLLQGDALGAACEKCADDGDAESLPPISEWFAAWAAHGILAKISS